MATKLKKIHLTSVDLVRAGANQEADICLYKSDPHQEGAGSPSEGEKNVFKRFIAWLRENHSEAVSELTDPNEIEKAFTTFDQVNDSRETRDLLWRYTDALTCSIHSIIDDRDLDKEAKVQMMNQSLQQFSEAMKGLFGKLCSIQPSNVEIAAVGKSDPDYDVIHEISKSETIVEVEKYNKYHGKDGRFASAPGGGGAVAGAGAGAASGEDIASDEPRASFSNSSSKEFASAVSKARESCSEDSKWRVTAHTQEELDNDYPGAKLHVTKGGSTVAVTSDGDIISVCKAAGDKEFRGRDLLRIGVENGGTKLDSFSGNHAFYTKCGFEPVSWTPFNEAYAPPGWRKGVDKAEPIVFYKHVGKAVNITLDDFLSTTKPFEGDDGYDKAMAYRNNSMEGTK